MREELVAELKARVMNLTPGELPAFIGALEEAKTFALMDSRQERPAMARSMTVEEAAERIGMSAAWIYKSKDLPFVRRIGRRVTCDSAKLERWLENRRVA